MRFIFRTQSTFTNYSSFFVLIDAGEYWKITIQAFASSQRGRRNSVKKLGEELQTECFKEGIFSQY